MRKKINKNPKRINKKAILAVIAAVAIVGGIAAFSAYEAHVINVTAHIENALSVNTTPIEFGTVFPQEYVEKEFIINLSSSFLGQNRVDEVDYIIVQKPKPIWPQTVDCQESHLGIDFEDINEARAYCHEYPENLDCCYLSLCPFLSKINEEMDEDEGEAENDTDAPSYYVKVVGAPDYCITPGEASGKLTKYYQDTEDRWVVDLKVPPIKGYVGQDWPAGCPTIDEDSKDYGCDLWIEVTGISETGEENGNEKALACTSSGGTVTTGLCCLATGDFPDTCQTGACGCSSENSHEVKVCNCGPDRCFNGTTCVDQCFPTTEICDDGIDNDCDGYIDCDDSDCIGDDACIVGCAPGSQRACNTGLLGVCTNGTQTCIPQAVWGECVSNISPSAEVCDALDNDCDGVTDEGNPGGGGSCSTGLLGICAVGTYQCQAGSLVCVQNNSPETEVCDALDNDCDGATDEGNPGGGGNCNTGQLGICAAGTLHCQGGSLMCVQNNSPQAEVCNDLDDDCDGEVDEGDVCPVNGWTYEQNFNSLADGNLNGQDGWLRQSGQNISVQTSIKYEGTKAISGVSNSSPDPTDYRRSITAINEGTVYVAMRVSAIPSGDGAYFILREGGSGRMNIGFMNDGNIKIYDNSSGFQTITSFSANQWYVIAVQFDDVNYANQYRAKVHDGGSWSAWSSWYTVVDGSYTNIDGIRLVNFGPLGSCTAYWDIITPNDPS